MRCMRNPSKHKFHEYVAHFNQLNGYLQFFPKPEPTEGEEDPGLPPYEDQMFNDNKVKDILEHGIPNKWAKNHD